MTIRPCVSLATVFAVVLTAALGIPSTANAQLEPIGPLLLVPNQPINMNYQNFIPPQPDYKELQFTGTASVPAGAVATLKIDFDYIDTTGALVIVPAPMSPIMIPGGAPFTFDSGILTLPFCPSLVSLHLENVGNAAAVPIQLQGTYRHRCFPVPEPSSISLLLGLGLVGFAWRRRQK